MKRLILALMLVLTTVCECYAVSDEVFEAKMEAFTSEIRGEFQMMNTKQTSIRNYQRRQTPHRRSKKQIST